VKRRDVLALSAFGMLGCARASSPSAPRTRALLNEASLFGEGTADDETVGLADLVRLAALVRQRVPLTESSVAARAQALNSVVFEQGGFVREVEDQAVEFAFLPAVLRSRRGSCVGLTTLYAALAELLGWSLECVIRPGHMYARLTQGEARRNLELLRRGEAMPDKWYDERWPIPGGQAPAYGRALRDDELLGVIAYNVGKQRQREGRYPAARHAFELAGRRFPAFGEAHASLGALLQLTGDLGEAEAAYERSRQVHPALPGVEQNLELLRAEREARPFPVAPSEPSSQNP
jgi:tetratricopeptide (TPR) repeat protein